MNDDWIACTLCGGTGEVSHCADGLCQGEDGCIHGDNEMCPECLGHGDIYVGPEDWFDDMDFDE